MADIPKLLQDKAREKSEKLLEQIMMLLATNSRSLEQKEFEEYIKKIIPEEVKQKLETFDRDKFEELRMLTNMGANRSR